MRSPRGLSLHIAVNHCDPDHYDGWSGPLTSCENDADLMQSIARARGFETRQLKTAEATRGAVTQAFRDAAAELSAGDLFLVSYSGHGGRIWDIDGDEEDGRDDTWCLYDGQLLDDELHVLFSEFKEGVRVLLVSDSCHSGTLLKGGSGAAKTGGGDDDFIYSRAMPRANAVGTARKNRSMYTEIQENLPKPRPPIRASVRLLSGCQEDEQSFGSKVQGHFTWVINDVYKNGAYEGNYKQFHKDLMESLSHAKNKQTPGHAVIGKDNPEFDQQSPFSI